MAWCTGTSKPAKHAAGLRGRGAITPGPRRTCPTFGLSQAGPCSVRRADLDRAVPGHAGLHRARGRSRAPRGGRPPTDEYAAGLPRAYTMLYRAGRPFVRDESVAVMCGRQISAIPPALTTRRPRPARRRPIGRDGEGPGQGPHPKRYATCPEFRRRAAPGALAGLGVVPGNRSGEGGDLPGTRRPREADADRCPAISRGSGDGSGPWGPRRGAGDIPSGDPGVWGAASLPLRSRPAGRVGHRGRRAPPPAGSPPPHETPPAWPAAANDLPAG